MLLAQLFFRYHQGCQRLLQVPRDFALRRTRDVVCSQCCHTLVEQADFGNNAVKRHHPAPFSPNASRSSCTLDHRISPEA